MKNIHPLLRWTLYGWLLSTMMASIVFVCHHFLPSYGVAVGVSLAYLIRLLLGRWREVKSFHKMADLLVGKESLSSLWGWVATCLFLVCLLLCVALLVVLPPLLAVATLFAVVPFSRMAASQLGQMLPYRGKSSLSSGPYSTTEGLLLFAVGVLPMAFLWWFAASSDFAVNWSWALFVPCVVLYGLYMLLAKRLRGFTYDSLVFVATMVELAFLLAVALS